MLSRWDDLKHVKDICYADNIGKVKGPALTIGLGCRVCERANCQHRGALPGGQHMRFDLSKRYSGLFEHEILNFWVSLFFGVT